MLFIGAILISINFWEVLFLVSSISVLFFVLNLREHARSSN